MSKVFTALIAIFALLPLCSGISVRDENGATVTLAQPAKRVISLSPHATELLYAIGAGDTLVGRDGASDYPAQALHVADVGQYGAFNLESILALKPDLVLAWVGPQAGPAITRLREMGIKVFATQPDSIDVLPQTMRALATLTARNAGSLIADDFEHRWLALKSRYAGRKPLRVVLQVAEHPAMTVNDKQFSASLLKACGASNLYGDNRAAVPLINDEAVLSLKPDAIIAMATGQSDWRKHWQDLGVRTALIEADAMTLNRPGPRVIESTERLCRQLDALRSH